MHDLEADAALAAELGVEHAPGFVLRGASKGTVRFLGIPAGYEFATLLEDVVAVSTGRTSLREATREALATLESDVHIRVFVTPSCPYCPGVASMAHQMAVESEHVTADVVEVSELPELGSLYSVSGVPKTVVNEDVELLGAQPEPSFLAGVLRAARV